MRTAGRLLRALVCVVAALAAYGWLDLLRHVPGPQLALVLPLRANGRGDGVSLVTVLLVFGATFAAIARIAPPRPSRITRSALVRSALLAAFTIAVGALQQGIVEQSRPSFAWGGALSLAWPWLAGAAALCGTLAAAPRAPRQPEAPPLHEPLPQQLTQEEPRPLEASAA